MSNSSPPEDPTAQLPEQDPDATRAFDPMAGGDPTQVVPPVDADPTRVVPPVADTTRVVPAAAPTRAMSAAPEPTAVIPQTAPVRASPTLAPPVLPPPNPSTRSGSYPVARWVHAAVAVVAWGALVVRLALIPLESDSIVSLLGALVFYLSNLGAWAAAVAAVVSTLLALNPIRKRRHFNALRLGSLAMVAVTALSFAPVLGAAAARGTPQWFIDGVLHYVVPAVVIGAYLGLGPRPRFNFGDLLPAMLFPVIWAGFALLSGVAAGTYPYSFVDVSTLGLSTALVNIGFLVGSAFLLAVGFILLDKFLPWAPRR